MTFLQKYSAQWPLLLPRQPTDELLSLGETDDFLQHTAALHSVVAEGHQLGREMFGFAVKACVSAAVAAAITAALSKKLLVGAKIDDASFTEARNLKLACVCSHFVISNFVHTLLESCMHVT